MACQCDEESNMIAFHRGGIHGCHRQSLPIQNCESRYIRHQIAGRCLRRLLRSLVRPRGIQAPEPSTEVTASQLRMLARFDSVHDDGMFPVPPGYRLIESGRARRGAWAELLSSSGEFGVVDAAMLKREILSILIRNGAVLIGHGDDLIACAAACFAPRFSPYSLLNYVLVREDHRARGLGLAASAEAMRRARQGGYSGMVLQTDDSREAAIRMYLSLGFQPVTESGPDAPARWEAVMKRLGLP